MPTPTLSSKDIRHLFGGAPSATPYTPSAADGPLAASVIRTPQAKPETLNAMFARLWEAQGNGLKPEIEYCFYPGRKWKFDFAWPDLLVAVEADGITSKGKGGRHNSDADREKINCAACEGWRVLRFSRAMMEDQPERCIEAVLKALEF